MLGNHSARNNLSMPYPNKNKNAVVRWRIIVINSVMPESVLSKVVENQYLTPYAKRES